MQWLSYFILAYLSVGIQVGASAYVRVNGAAPNIVLLTAIFIAMHAATETAWLACLMLGLTMDLVSQNAMGLYAFSFGLAGMLTSAVSKVANKGHPVSQFFIALAAGFVVALCSWMYGLLKMPAGSRITLMTLLGGVLYTAILAPIVLGVLHRIRGIFGFEVRRRKV